ncbi:MAG TPA: transcriptional regulator, partial [Roseiflexaceae bacterium]|nr:transcriptional regulator [Roseiflexaceae bacterium]
MTAHLSLTLFGSLQYALDGVALTAFDSDKTRALLAYLSVEAAQSHRRTALIGLFWPESGEAAARRSLSQALLVIRQAIGDYTAQPPFLRITRDTIGFDTASNHTLDVAVFERLLAAV